MERVGRLLERVRAVGDHDAVGLVAVQETRGQVMEVGDVGVGHGVGGHAPERDTGDGGDGRQLG